MQKSCCPKCGSNDLIDDMETIYGMWGELLGAEEVKRCLKCGETLMEDRKYEGDTT
jgi:predicted nucleic-acid-binding Zn-ribbon protein